MMVKSCDVLVFYILIVQTEIWVPLKLVIKNGIILLSWCKSDVCWNLV